ncbi:MAG: TIGR04338 family metallohydrolase [Jatrophihabitans sp.]
MTERDVQRARVYEAEGLVARMIDRRLDFPVAEAFGSRVVVPDDRKFGDIASVQRYADAVLALGWVGNDTPVTIRARRGSTKAEYEFESATIAVPPHDKGGRWAMRELVILHELAHHLVGKPDHGPAYVARFLELVDGLIGAEAAFLLRASLLDSGVQMA